MITNHEFFSVEQIGKENIFLNADCMDYLRQMPDNCVELAICDPPYGDALHADDGGCKGWFTKYNQKVNPSENGGGTTT